jgi:perosamine synthetase
VIPVCEPQLGEKEGVYLAECVRSGWVSSSGPFIEQFEQRWAEYCGRRHGVAVCNGTAALQCAVAALGLAPGNEVIMPSFTIVSCAQAIVACGAVPVLVDADAETWTMDVGLVESKISPRTRAIMPVHIYGHPVDLDPILTLADKHGLAVIEDAAEAHGAQYRTVRDGSEPGWRRCGGFGDMSCFSFYANKIITTGEGGMVLTDDAMLDKRLRSLRNLCFGDEQRFRHEQLGYNFRMTNMQAAIGLAQLERIDEILQRKRRIGAGYAQGLEEVSAISFQCCQPWARSVYWMNGIVIDEKSGFSAADVSNQLRVRGIDTRPFFTGMHDQPALLRLGMFAGESYPVTSRLSRQGLYLPSGSGLTQEQIDTVCNAIGEVFP